MLKMTATIKKIERLDQTLNVVVEYTSEDFYKLYTFNFPGTKVITKKDVDTEINRVGKEYLNALNSEQNLKSTISSTLAI